MAENEQNGPSMSDAVRELVEANDLDPKEIHASGKNGRLLKSDVEAFLGEQHGNEADEAPADQAEPEAVRVTKDTHVTMMIGNAKHYLRFSAGEIVTESHKVRELMRNGVAEPTSVDEGE